MGTHNLCVLWYQIRQNSPAEKSPREGSSAHSSLELKINLHYTIVVGGSQVEESPKASGYFKKKREIRVRGMSMRYHLCLVLYLSIFRGYASYGTGL